MKPKVLVIGANGMLGSVVTKYLQSTGNYNVVPLTSKNFDILRTPVEALEVEFEDDSASYYIVNCAGIIKPRLEWYEVEDVFKINSLFPVRLAQFARRIGMKTEKWVDVFHISTDCVFTGKKGNYEDDDIPDSTDLYGMSKSLGECADANSMVIRTSIIGEEINNQYSLLEWAKANAGKEVSGWTDHMWSGVTTLQLAKFIETNIEDSSCDEGIWHYASSPVNKWELLHFINDVYKLNLKIKKVSSGVPCDRTLISSGEDDFRAPVILAQLYELQEFFARWM